MARCESSLTFPSVTFVPVFIPSGRLRPHSFRTKLVDNRHPHTRPPLVLPRQSRSALLLASFEEEELFIRRCAPRANAPTTEQPQQVPPQTAHPDDTEEQFHFIQDPDPEIAQTQQESTPKAPTNIDLDVPQKENQRETLVDPANVPIKSHDKTIEQSPVRVVNPPGLRGFGLRLRKETSKLFKETQLVSPVRMPTRRETVVFAWQFAIILALLMLLRAGVSSTLRWIHNRLNATRGLKSNIPYEASVFECMQRPLEFLSLFTVGTALAEAVSRPLAAIGLLRHIRVLRELGIIISAAWFLLRWIDRIRSRFSVAKGIDKAQLDATSRIATVVTFVASLLISLDTVGVNVQTVLAFGGIGGVAIGFAGREIISNFFGGFMIYVTRPFSVGEWIRSIEEEELNGTVEDIGWYLTRVRTWDKRPLYIPNSRFSTLIVENGSRMDNRRILHTLQLRHEDMPVVPDIVASIEVLLMNHQELDPRQHRLAYVDSFGDFSVRIWLSCYTKSVFLYDFRRVQQDILVKCYDIIRANGAKLATINTRDVRPGTDTDRYGPFGTAASFNHSTAGSRMPQPVSNRNPINNDVPGAQQYGGRSPVVRFHNIESGVDLSQMELLSSPNGVPTGTALNTNGQPSSVGNTAGNDVAALDNFSRDSVPQRSTSAAAVAAAAAALAAARRNAARIENSERSVPPQTMGQTENAVSTGASTEAQSTTTAPPGQMKIIAAKPGRSAQAPTVSTEDARRSDTHDDSAESPTIAASGGEKIGQSRSASPHHNISGSGEMIISKARKPSPTTQANVDTELLESPEKPATSESEDQSDLPKLPKTSTDPRSGAAQNARMKISSVKPSTLGGVIKPVTSTKPSAGTGSKPPPTESIPKEANLNPTSQASQPLRSDSPHAKSRGTTQQTSPNISGEMKISKARKPTPLTPITPESDGKKDNQGNSQSHDSPSVSNTPGTVTPHNPMTSEDQSSET